MKEPTTAEIYRLFQAFDEKLDAILVQTTKHNGRMTSLETWKDKVAEPLLEDYKDKRSQGSGMIKVWAVMGGSIFIIIGLTATLYVKDLKMQIRKELEECCIIQLKT